MLRWKLFRSKWVAIIWLLFITFLFMLPGSALPENNLFIDLQFDKVVHVCLFAALLFLFRSSFALEADYYPAILMILALCYGLGIEYVQQNFVSNRSFDGYDVVADMIGSLVGLLVHWWVYKKNKPL